MLNVNAKILLCNNQSTFSVKHIQLRLHNDIQAQGFYANISNNIYLIQFCFMQMQFRFVHLCSDVFA